MSNCTIEEFHADVNNPASYVTGSTERIRESGFAPEAARVFGVLAHAPLAGGDALDNLLDELQTNEYHLHQLFDSSQFQNP